MNENKYDPIAVVGLACRFPGAATDPEKFWELSVNGINTWSDVPSERFNWRAFHDAKSNNASTLKHRGGHFLDEDISVFDAEFFGISPLEARCIDPQQRILLETTYEALENAGIQLEHVRTSKVGVFCSMFSQDYDRMMFKDISDVPKYQSTGTESTFLANRISYAFDLRGPSITVNTACSGGLVALHLACQSLGSHECHAAIVGGANLILSPDAMVGMTNLKILNENGRSYAFDSRGDGYGRGEGSTVLVLKRMADAIKNGDSIRAVIRGTSVNHNGRTSGITMPDPVAQADLIRSTYKKAGMNFDDCTYVEAHGTGTIVGDFAEISALASLESTSRSREQCRFIGSVKANVGHLENVSGLAGVLNAILVLEKGIIPPIADLRTIKDTIVARLGTFQLPTQALLWPETATRLASVNSFGFGGTNSHVILEAAHPSVTPLPADRDAFDSQARLMFVFSAKSKYSLLRYLERMADWLTQNKADGLVLADLAYTLARKKSLFSWRYAMPALNIGELLSKLGSVEPQRISTPRVVFLFTGQGAQWYAMGRELIKYCKEFQQSLSTCDKILKDLGSSWSLLEELQKDKEHSRINESEISMPAITALQIALVDLLEMVGCRARAVVGHSSGEIAAAYCVRALSREAALAASYHRSFMSSIAKKSLGVQGGMMAVGMHKKEVTELLSTARFRDLSIACHNSPSSITVSGGVRALDELQEVLDQRQIFNRRLLVDTAFHSQHMKIVAGTYLSSLAEIESSTADPSQVFISSVTGERKYEGFGSAYWTQNLVSTVRFSDAIENYFKIIQNLDDTDSRTDRTIFLEIGPHSVLSGPMKQILAQPQFQGLSSTYVPTLRRSESALVTLVSCLATIFNSGCQVDILSANRILGCSTGERFVPNVPSYAWNHETPHWHESMVSRNHRFRKHMHHRFLGVQLSESSSLEPIWQNKISVIAQPWLLDHVIDSFVIFPAAAYLAMAIEGYIQLLTDKIGAGKTVREGLQIRLENVKFSRALTLAKNGEELVVRMSMRHQDSTHAPRRAGPESSLSNEFLIVSSTGGSDWHEHCRGFVEGRVHGKSLDTGLSDLSTSCEQFEDTFDHFQVYGKLRQIGNDYGSSFSRIEKLDLSLNNSIATLRSYPLADPDSLDISERHVIHPTTLDAIMHSCLLSISSQTNGCAIVPVQIKEMVVSTGHPLNDSTRLIIAESLINATTHRNALADITAGWKDDKERAIAIYGIELKCLSSTTLDTIDPSSQNMCHRVQWMPDVRFLLRRPLELGEFLPLYAFKLPQCRIAVTSQHADRLSLILNALRSCVFPNGHAIDIVAASHRVIHTENGTQCKEMELQYHNNNDDVSIIDSGSKCADASFDLIICEATATPFTLSTVCRLLKPMGKALVPTNCSLELSQRLENMVGQAWPSIIAETLGKDAEHIKIGMENSGLTAYTLPRYYILDRSETGMLADNEGDHCASSAQSNDVSQLSISVIDQDLRPQTSKVNDLLAYLTPLSATLHCSTWNSLGSPEHGICIVYDYTDYAFLANVTEKQFELLKRMVETASTIIWITYCTSNAVDSLSLEGLVVGFARTCRSEYEKLDFITVSVQDHQKNKAILGDLVVKILTDRTATESDYILKDGEVLIPRVISDANIGSWMSDKIASPQHETCSRPFHEPGKIASLSYSSNTGYHFVQEAYHHHPSAGMIRLAMKAFATEDDFYSQGLTNEDRVISVAGEVIAVSADIQKGLNPGDRVFAWTSGSRVIASVVDIPAENVHALGSNVPITTGADALFTYAAIHCALTRFGPITAGQDVLIDIADVSMAHAAVSVCTEAGARPKIMVPDSETAYDLGKRLNLKEDQLLVHTNNLSVRRSLSHATVDVVLIYSGKVPTAELFSLTRTFGTIIHLGRTCVRKDKSKIMQTNSNVTHVFLNLPALCQYKPDQINASMRAASKFYLANYQAQLPLARRTIPVRDLVDTLNKTRTHMSNGLLYVDCSNDLPVGVHSKSTIMTANSDFDGIYIVAGGFGDLGRMICILLAKLGAKHILVLSRRAASAQVSKKLQREVKEVNPLSNIWSEQCDIMHPGGVEELTKRYTESLGFNLKGIVHSAVVMKDRTLANMTLNEFNIPLGSKLYGTISLASLASKFKPDFFISLSSYVGLVGGRGQAAYAAGNTYQNRVAQTQSGSKTRFHSLDLPIIIDSDFIVSDANGPIRSQNLARQGCKPINKATISAFIEYFITRSLGDSYCSHAAFGFDAQSFSEASSLTPSAKSMLFSHLHAKAHARQAKEQAPLSDTMTVLEQLQSTVTSAAKKDIVQNAIVHQLELLLGLGENSISGDQRIADLGLDSLLAIELKNWVAKSLQATLQVSEILDSQDVDSLICAVLKYFEAGIDT